MALLPQNGTGKIVRRARFLPSVCRSHVAVVAGKGDRHTLGRLVASCQTCTHGGGLNVAEISARRGIEGTEDVVFDAVGICEDGHVVLWADIADRVA